MRFHTVRFRRAFNGVAFQVTFDEAAHVISVLRVVDVIEIRRIEHVDGTLLPAVPKRLIARSQRVEIGGIDDLFGVDRTAMNTRENDVGWRVEIEDEIRAANVVTEQFGEPVVESHFFFVERLFGKEAIFFEEIIRDGETFEKGALEQLDLLLIASCEVKHLCRERVMFWIRVETRQKGVGLARFENETRIEAFAQEVAKACLSDTNQSFNDNVIRQRNTPKICDLILKSDSIGRRVA